MMSNGNEIQKKVTELSEIQPWNHNYMLPGGIETNPGTQVSQGKNLIKFKRLEPLLDFINLKDINVLDIGCNEGFFSLEMAKKGAHVLGLDIDLHRIQKARYIKSLLGADKQVSFNQIDIYSSEFKALTQFDLCLCLGFIHRIPDPVREVAPFV